LHDFGDRHGTNIAGEPGLAQFSGDNALNIASLIESNVVGINIERALVSDCMLIENRRMPLGGILVHAAEHQVARSAVVLVLPGRSGPRESASATFST
jgi:hypothetical protein